MDEREGEKTPERTIRDKTRSVRRRKREKQKKNIRK